MRLEEELGVRSCRTSTFCCKKQVLERFKRVPWRGVGGVMSTGLGGGDLSW
jgi:hypothetical protein